MSALRIIALLGRRDEPADAVEEYCAQLGEALSARGMRPEIVRVAWETKGWRAALAELAARARDWNGAWVLLQYTALAWSRRGFPRGALRVLRAARQGGARTAVVFHDARAFGGRRIVDRLRSGLQTAVMRCLLEESDRVVLTIPADRVPWLPARLDKATFIPVGANLPPGICVAESVGKKRAAAVVAVFGVTGGAQTEKEAADIAFAVNRAAQHLSGLRLVVFGRNSLAARAALRRQIDPARVRLETLGVLPAAQVAETLAAADVLLFVRGHLSSRRGSALAGIALGLPVVGYAGQETAAPVTDAGVVLVREDDRQGLAEALERVLSDDALRFSLCERSARAYREHFSWDVIAARFASALDGAENVR